MVSRKPRKIVDDQRRCLLQTILISCFHFILDIFHRMQMFCKAGPSRLSSSSSLSLRARPSPSSLSKIKGCCTCSHKSRSLFPSIQPAQRLFATTSASTKNENHDSKAFAKTLLLPKTAFPLRADAARRERTFRKRTTSDLYDWQVRTIYRFDRREDLVRSSIPPS